MPGCDRQKQTERIAATFFIQYPYNLRTPIVPEGQSPLLPLKKQTQPYLYGKAWRQKTTKQKMSGPYVPPKGMLHWGK
jgi:hypothetical protein